MTVGTYPATLDEINLSEWAFWEKPPAYREQTFALLRAQPHPVFFKEQKWPFIRKGPGFYALVKHADVTEASRNPAVFSNEPCSTYIPDMPRYVARYFGSIINMDDPRHGRIRRIVSRAFTPHVLAKMESDLQASARRIVDDLIAKGPCDFVTNVAARLPLQVICDMMGVPEDRREMVFHHTNIVLGNADPEYTGFTADFNRRQMARAIGKLVQVGHELHRMAMRLGRDRRRAAAAGRPLGDLTTALVTANVDGEKLTDQELGSFFILLLVAGSETTRNAISHGLKLLTDHADRRALLLEDFDTRIGGALEEILRLATPVINFRRTLTRDFELNGFPLKAGNKVLLYLNSANRDEAVFDRPDVFDITRTDNPHLAFGAPGPHFCLGPHLARREMTVMFRELLTRLPGIKAEGEPDRLLSNFINGIKHMQCTF
jgi:methyl-branched lipid omega-hydroxylase